MEITEVRIKLMEEASERLRAFCSVTFDDAFVVRDLKIIEGASGPFVAMPSRKLTTHCPGCGCKNHMRAAYCNQCGNRLKEERLIKDEDGRAKLYADIAHPINSACREMIQNRVICEFHEELDRSKLPGYVSRYEDYDGELAAEHSLHGHHRREGQASRTEEERQVQVQHAEAQPRGPHRAPSPPGSRQPSGPHREGFGAGIF